MADLIILTLFPALVIAAGIGDFLTMKIPNWLNGLIGFSFFPVALLAGMPVEQIGWHVVAGLLVLIVAFVCFGFGFFGGGDAKMLAVAGLWLGLGQLGNFLIFMALVGGLLAIVMKFWWLVKLETDQRGIKRLKGFFKTSIDLPYGIAIAAGALFSFQHSWWVVAANSQIAG
jgi:prepilin peptidase CpaA